MPLLMKWVNSKTKGYPGAHISNFNVSLKDGLALCAIIHATNKSLLCWVDLDKARVLFLSVQFPRVLSKGSRYRGYRALLAAVGITFACPGAHYS